MNETIVSNKPKPITGYISKNSKCENMPELGMNWHVMNRDYSDFCFDISKEPRAQDKAIKQWLTWFPETECSTAFAKEQIVKYWLDDYRRKGILKVYDGTGKNLITTDEVCFTTAGKYFIEKSDFDLFCKYIGINSQTEPQLSKVNADGTKPQKKSNASGNDGERELTAWLRETWIKENKPEGTDFFMALKKYANLQDSPIVNHYTAGKKGAGIRWNTGNATKTMFKKTIQNRVSIFKNELLKKPCQ